jgi:hypothetical protein
MRSRLAVCASAACAIVVLSIQAQAQRLLRLTTSADASRPVFVS